MDNGIRCSYDANTGKITITSDDNIGFQTDDLRISGGGSGNNTNLKYLHNRALDISDNEILTFEHIPNGDSYSLFIKTRSITSVSNYYKTNTYQYTTTPPLNQFDIPYPPFIYTFTKEYIEQVNTARYDFQTEETFENGEPQTELNNSGGNLVPWRYFVLTGDIIKYLGPDDIWSLYYTSVDLRGATSTFDDLILLKTFKNNEEFVFDTLLYNDKRFYMVKDNDIIQRVYIKPQKPDIYIDNIRTGPYFNTQAYNPEYKYQTYISDVSRQIWYQFLTPERPFYLNEDESLIETPGGIPGNSSEFYDYSWFINNSPISTLFESGDLSVAVSIFFDCKQAGVSGLKPGKLLNSVSSIRNPNNTEIEGIPDLVDQVFELTLTTLDTTNNKSYWTGKDRNREYDNEEILTIELYYDDVLKITYGPGIYDFIINNSQWVFIDIPNGSLLTSGNVGPDGLNEEFIVKYPKTQFDQLYKLKIYHNSGPETI